MRSILIVGTIIQNDRHTVHKKNAYRPVISACDGKQGRRPLISRPCPELFFDFQRLILQAIFQE